MNRLFLVFLILAMFLLTSCGYKDIDKRAFVLTIGVDEGESRDKKYKVLLKIVIPASDTKAGKSEFIVSEHESNSITDAVRMIKTKVDKELDFSHAKVIIFNEAVLHEDLDTLLDWFIRRRDIQKVAWVGIGKPSAEEILKLDRKVEMMPSNSLFLSFGHTGTESVYIVSEYLFDLRKRITEKGLDPILPILEMKDNKYFEINKAAVFSNEGLKATLNPEETKILNILLNRANKVDVNVKQSGDEDQDLFFIAVDESNTKFEIQQDPNGLPRVKVTVSMEGILEEVLIDLNKSSLEESKEMAENQVKEKVLKLLLKLQKEEVDPIGFGLRYRATHYNKDDWEQWVSMYPKVEFDVKVEIMLQGTGLLRPDM
ncbi:Ger(x)C family spore germination protein [Cytobacillus suaedae]|nr:Ger(x)C family spore germination protein [Cytobacillus suaedae]